MADIKNDNKTELRKQLEHLADEVRTSWVKDCDKTDEMKELTQIIEKMLESETLEEFFDNNEGDLSYFMKDCLKEVISNILYQPVVYGNDGDEVALDLLYHIFLLFTKFHKNKAYAPLFEKIRDIFKQENMSSYFMPSERGCQPKIENPKKKYTFLQFNNEFCSEFVDSTKKGVEYKEGDKVDILIDHNASRAGVDKKAWVRGIVTQVENRQYTIRYNGEDNLLTLPVGSTNILPEGTKTKDWDWRLNLKEYDLVDAFDRNKWFPATIYKIFEENENYGYKKRRYTVGFRLYLNHFNNEEDPNDNPEKHSMFWSKSYGGTDVNGEQYIGDKENYDEQLYHYSNRIQKFNTYSAVQKDYLDANGYYNYPYNTNTKIKEMNEALENLDEGIDSKIDEMFFYEKDNKINYIIGKGSNFSYYFALLLRKIASDGYLEEFINLLKNKPNTEEIYMIFYIFSNTINYIHKEFFRRNAELFKNSLFSYINNLDNKEMRNLPKDLIDMLTSFVVKINDVVLGSDNKKDSDLLSEITINMSFKMIKTSIFDRRLQGVKSLNEYISKTKGNEKAQQKLIDLIKKNEIINEIFGSNYHSQIISKSNDIVDLLLKYDQLTDDDVKLIWGCTQKGDLEAKLTILKLLSDLSNQLNEKYINILMNNVINSSDGKLNQNEIDLVYNLFFRADNEECKIKCIEYFCQSLLKSTSYNIDNNPILEKLLTLISIDDKYFLQILNICETHLKDNSLSILCFSFLSSLIQKFVNPDQEKNILSEKEPLNNFLSNDHLLKLFEDNFKKYIEDAKENIKRINSESESQLSPDEIDKMIINKYTHIDNVQKRLSFLNNLVGRVYYNYDFIPFLKKLLLDNPVSSNDKSLFYEFMKNYISSNNDINVKNDTKDKIKSNLLKLFTENNQSQMTMEQFTLFMVLFFDINKTKIDYKVNKSKDKKEDEYEIDIKCNVEEIEGMDKLWEILFQLKEESVLNKVINVLFQMYKNENDMKKLLDKSNDLIKDEKATSEQIEKSIKLLRLIIIESEKNYIISTKPHLSLLKNSLINFLLDITNKVAQNNRDIKELFYDNTNVNELKLILVKKFEVPIDFIQVFLHRKQLNEKTNKKEKKDIELDYKYNNISLNELIVPEIKSPLGPNEDKNDKLPKKILTFTCKTIPQEPLVTDKVINPKFQQILHDWFYKFTEGSDQMDKKGCSVFISNVTTVKEAVPEDDYRVKNFFAKYDTENKGYITEEKFIDFYYSSVIEGRAAIVWDNLKAMGVREDLKGKDEPYENIIHIENNKLPRYILGNDESFLNTLFNLFNKFPQSEKIIYDFLFFLSTNEKIYNQVLLNLNSETKIIDEIIKDDKQILKLIYILVIIESFLQDIELQNINCENIFENDNKIYNFLMSSNKYEPFDTIDISQKNKFIEDFIISKNYEKLINFMNDMLKKYKNKIIKRENNNSILRLCCIKGLKIISIIYRACLDINNDNILANTLTESIYDLDYTHMNSLMKDNQKAKEMVLNFSYVDLVKNLIDILTQFDSENNNTNNYDSKIDDSNNNDNILLNYCFDLLIKLISFKDDLLTELSNDKNSKNKLSDLIKNYLNNTNPNNNNNVKNNSHSSKIKSIIDTLKSLSNKTENEKENANANANEKKNKKNSFISFLFEITNLMLNDLLNNQIKINKSSDSSSKSQITLSSVFFDFFSQLYETQFCDTKETPNIELLYKIYEILIKDFTENNPDKKLSNEIINGLMNILLSTIKKNDAIKKELLNKKINNETLVNAIINKIICEPLDKDNEESKEENLINTDKDSKQTEEEKFILIDPSILESAGNATSSSSNNTINNISKQDIKENCYNYVFECLQSSEDPSLVEQVMKINQKLIELKEKSNESNETATDEDKTKSYYYRSSYNLTKSCGHVGLNNLGCICYMNSIMQQIYMVPTFRYAVMHSDDNEPPKPISTAKLDVDDDNLLHQLQKMYTYLTLSEKGDYNPKCFCYSFKDFDGNPTNPMVQQDSQEFYNNFCDKIENCLQKTKYKYTVNDVFSGRTCSSVICEECKHVSNRFEDFYNLTLEVKNINNLNDSLQKLIVPETIDDFKCSNCNKNVTINKITSLSSLPNALVIHLKRFYMNYETERTEKINSRFEFPDTLNLKSFCVEELTKKIKKGEETTETEEIYFKSDDYYEYVLKGVNVHMGSADGGHYFSFIDVDRDGKGNELKKSIKKNWLKFNDSHVSVFDTNDIPNECYGGPSENSTYASENFQNAYLLIYERKIKTPIRVLIDEKDISEDDKKNNLISFNKDEVNTIMKKYDISKINNNIKEDDLYKLIFHNSDKNEYYKYIPYYDLPKYAPRAVYNEVMKENKNISSGNSNDTNKNIEIYKNKIIDIIINYMNNPNINFNIWNYNLSESQFKEIITLFSTELFTKYKNGIANDNDKVVHNERTKIILTKFFSTLLNEKTDNQILLYIERYLFSTCYLEIIYSNEATKIYNLENVKLFTEIFHKLINAFYNLISKNESKIESKNEPFILFKRISNLIKKTETVYTQNENENIPFRYIYQLLLDLIKERKESIENIIKTNYVRILLSRLSCEAFNERNLIYEIIISLIRYTNDYDNRTFDIPNKEEQGSYELKEKDNLRDSINDSNSIIELLFEEKLDLFIMLIKILEKGESEFSNKFNSEHLKQLFDYALLHNKIPEILEVICGIVEINDYYSFDRIKMLIGYPILIVKEIKEDTNSNNNDEETEANENEKKNNINKQKWPLFGAQLIKENKNDLKTQIYKYICINRDKKFCLLAQLFPCDSDKDIRHEGIEEEKRKKIIYKLLNICFKGTQNYSLFKYLYLMPSRSIYYNNLYEEMIDCLEGDKKYDLSEIKKIAEICIKYIEFEIKRRIMSLGYPVYFDEEESNGKIKLPEDIEDKYITTDDITEYLGFNSDIIPCEIIREEVSSICEKKLLYLYRIEFFCKYTTPSELKNNILNNLNSQKEDQNPPEKKEEPKQEEEKDKEKEKDKETQQKEKEDENKENPKTEEEKKEQTNKEEVKEGEEEKNNIDNNIDNNNENKNDEEKEQKDDEILIMNTEIKYEQDNEESANKVDISESDLQKSDKEFIFEMNRRIKGYRKIIIEDSTITNKDNVKSVLIRYVLVNLKSLPNNVKIKVNVEKMPEEVKINFPFPIEFEDFVERINIVNFLTINRIRKDFPFVEKDHTGINIDCSMITD